jgi:hypothetical protein
MTTFRQDVRIPPYYARQVGSLSIGAMVVTELLGLLHETAHAAFTSDAPPNASARRDADILSRTKTVTYPQAKSTKEVGLAKFVARQEGRADTARKNLTMAIEKCERQIMKLPIDNDAKALRLKPLTHDRLAFETQEHLPSSAELSEYVGQFVRTYVDIRVDVRLRLDAETKKAGAKIYGQGMCPPCRVRAEITMNQARIPANSAKRTLPKGENSP